MAEERDDSQKTEQPTQRRLDEARKQGDIVKSQEVSTFVLLAGGLLVIATLGSYTAKNLAESMRIYLAEPAQMNIDSTNVMALAQHLVYSTGSILAPVLGLLMLLGLAGHVVQHRPGFSAEKLKPDLAKLSLLKGFKRMFGTDGWINLAKGLLKISIVGAAVWYAVWPERGRIEAVLTLSPMDVAGVMVHMLIKVAMAALAVLAVLAAGDYFLQRFQFMQRNRMSKQEIKEEFRQTEGDPTVKAKIKQIRAERSRRRMMAAVPEATVVIMNPTHYAVALKYESGKMAAPMCVAKGVDAVALRIRDVAREHEVPVIENPPLARALYATVEIDEMVPPEHFKAVAQVIGYVMRLTGKMRPN
ncbi:MAG: flagellar biosynthesis protein FlhB [Alphaproteobacteria bacterium]|nr:flagellar biosynthesis protein FlhB [Alphaproteobacteria bacterium]